MIVSCCVWDRVAPPAGWVAVKIRVRVWVPAGVPFATGGGGDMEPPLHAVIAAAAKAHSKTATNRAKARDSRKGRTAELLRINIEKKAKSSAKGQRIWKRLAGCRNQREGPKGITDPLAVVFTLIATVAGAACVTVTGEAGPVHVALTGAPVQLTVTMS